MIWVDEIGTVTDITRRRLTSEAQQPEQQFHHSISMRSNHTGSNSGTAAWS